MRDDPGSNSGRREVDGRSVGAFGGTNGGLRWALGDKRGQRTRQEARANRGGASGRGRWVGRLMGKRRTGGVRPGVESLAAGRGRG